MTFPILLAMDRASTARRVDVDGRLHVSASNMTKANVCPYFGSEIPGWQHLGLQADRRYNLLRHPDELRSALDTFNNLPVLSEHVPVTADDHQPHIVVGSTGTHAAFDGTYLTNSLVVWARDSIDGVVNGRQKELSCAYRYTPDMTPGNYDGLQYDGIMRNIVGNHVALVVEGRAGPDVVVGDERMKLKSKAALMAGGALTAMVRPLLAADAKVDIAPVLADVTAANLVDQRGSIADKVVALVTPHLAADKAIDKAGVEATLATIAADAKDDAIAEPAPTPTPSPTPAPTPVTPDTQPTPGVTEAAMDAAIAKARSDALAEGAAIRTAEREVYPHVGEIVAQDSAAGVYKFALDAAKVDLTGVDVNNAATLRAMVKMLPQPTTEQQPLASDSAASSDATADFAKRFPTAVAPIRS